MNDSLITFTGWVGSQVEVAEVREGVHVATFRVGCTPRRPRDGRWEDGETVWYGVKAWRRLAENVGASLRVGDPVVVVGRFEAESWTTQEGNVVTRHVVVASSVGHDLARGRSAFVKPAPAVSAQPPASSVPAPGDEWAVPSVEDHFEPEPEPEPEPVEERVAV